MEWLWFDVLDIFLSLDMFLCNVCDYISVLTVKMSVQRMYGEENSATHVGFSQNERFRMLCVPKLLIAYIFFL